MSPMRDTMWMMGIFFLVMALYAALKIVAGVLILRYGKRYAEKVKREEEAP